MPYRCSAEDDNPVVIHLQQLDDGFDQVDFCQEHWVQFILASAQALAPNLFASGADPAPDGDGPPDPQDGPGAVTPTDEAPGQGVTEDERLVVEVGTGTSDDAPPY